MLIRCTLACDNTCANVHSCIHVHKRVGKVRTHAHARRRESVWEWQRGSEYERERERERAREREQEREQERERRDMDEADTGASSFPGEEQLQEIGGDMLKQELQKLGLKCGGSVAERAKRLWATKGKSFRSPPSTLNPKR